MGSEFFEGNIVVGYNKGLKQSDIPQRFRIYFTPMNQWHPIITMAWFGHEQGLTGDTFLERNKNHPYKLPK